MSIASAILLLLLGVVIVFKFRETPSPAYNVSTVVAPFIYSFNTPGVVYEKEDASLSTSPYWWLNSGGLFVVQNGVGGTNQGKLSPLNRWRIAYAKSSSADTDDGYYPQNLFRLISRSKWNNFREEAYFQIQKNNLTASDNRNESNGLLLFSRYKDHNNLYYMGVRVDGQAVIKKKQGSIYHTLAIKKILDGEYSKENNPNLLPTMSWIGVRSEIKDQSDGSVLLTLYIDKKNDGHWQEVLKTEDKIEDEDGPPIKGEGYIGIRTDFMDVLFRDFVVTTL